MKTLKFVLLAFMISFACNMSIAQTPASKSDKHAKIENKLKKHPKAAKKLKHRYIKKHKA